MSSGSIDLNGVRTWYEERGDGDALVLLYGGFSDSRDFDGNLDALARRFRLFCPSDADMGTPPTSRDRLRTT
jgi:pimeloyl-ACP methyl ester carboxylesterase